MESGNAIGRRRGRQERLPSLGDTSSKASGKISTKPSSSLTALFQEASSMSLPRNSLNTPKNMVRRVLGLSAQSNPRPILGYSDDETVMLDFDDTPLRQVKYWAIKAKKKFRLKGYAILRSSKNSYHIVFDRKVTWPENMGIVAWVAQLSRKESLRKWFLMQCIKGSSTLRVSSKNEKPPPRLIFKHGTQIEQIWSFLEHRRKINVINRDINVKKSGQSVTLTTKNQASTKTKRCLNKSKA